MVVAAVQLGLWHCRRTVVSIVSRRHLPVVCLPSLPATGDAAISPAIVNSSVHISAYSDSVVQVWRQCLQCFDVVGWAAGTASGSPGKRVVKRVCVFVCVYGDSVDNTVEENSIVFSLIRMHWLPSARACAQ